MKKVKTVLALIPALSLLLMLFSGLGVTKAAAKTAPDFYRPAKKTYNFVFIPKLVHEWYENVKVGIEKAKAEYAKAGITVNYTWDAPSTADVLVQTQKLEASAARKPDGISVAVLDESVIAPIINQIAASGIKVSTFDVDAPKSNRLFYCGHADNYGDGVKMADMLANKIGKKGEVAVLLGTLSAPNHQERVKGFNDRIAKYPGIKVVSQQADDDQVEKAMMLTENILKAHPKLKGIYGCNGSNPIGAARAVSDAGKAGKIVIVGMSDDQDTMRYINKGVIYATIVQNVQDIGYYSVINMLQLADGKKPAKTELEVGAAMVTKKNVASYIKK